MRTCFVPGCESKRRHLNNRKMFTIPKNKAIHDKWAQVLPQLRPLRDDDRVCCAHFRPEDIVEKFQHTINGKIFEIERDRPKLAPQAVPCRNLPNAQELEMLKAKRRGAKRQTAAKQKQKDATTSEQQPVVEAPKVEGILSQTEWVETISTSSAFDDLFDNIYDVILPNTLWGIHRCPQRTTIVISQMDLVKRQYAKLLIIESSGGISMYLANRLIMPVDVGDIVTPNVDFITNLLEKLDNIYICQGENKSKDCEIKALQDGSGLCNKCKSLKIIC